MKHKIKSIVAAIFMAAITASPAIFTNAFAADTYKAYIICAHPGGGWCQHFQTYEAAKKAAEEHRKKGGIHESCRPDSGKCPLH